MRFSFRSSLFIFSALSTLVWYSSSFTKPKVKRIPQEEIKQNKTQSFARSLLKKRVTSLPSPSEKAFPGPLTAEEEVGEQLDSFAEEIDDVLSFAETSWEEEVKNYFENVLFLTDSEVQEYWSIIREVNQQLSDQLRVILEEEEDLIDRTDLFLTLEETRTVGKERIKEILGHENFQSYTRFKKEFSSWVKDRYGQEEFYYVRQF